MKEDLEIIEETLRNGSKRYSVRRNIYGRFLFLKTILFYIELTGKSPSGLDTMYFDTLEEAVKLRDEYLKNKHDEYMNEPISEKEIKI